MKWNSIQNLLSKEERKSRIELSKESILLEEECIEELMFNCDDGVDVTLVEYSDECVG
jgi:hypothetical protein